MIYDFQNSCIPAILIVLLEVFKQLCNVIGQIYKAKGKRVQWYTFLDKDIKRQVTILFLAIIP